MPIYTTKEEIYTRNGIFDLMLDSCFDAAALIDTDLRIIHHSKGGDEFFNGMPYEETIGMPIKELDSFADFEKAIRTGEDSKYTFTIITGKQCVHHIIPIVENGEVIAVLATVIFKDLSVLKKILVENYTDDREADILYNKISRFETNYTFNNFMGRSPAILRALDKASKLAALKHSVLIFGETGTGKEILANGIHAASRSGAEAPLIKINCSAIPAELLESELFGHEKGAFTGAVSKKMGKFELARNGSILLDEIGEMDLSVQAKLLRALEEKEFERVGGNQLIPLRARIIASTNKNLEEQCKRGRFRPDLYYRLCHFEIYIPPLRERGEDILLLFNHFMDKAGIKKRIAPEAMDMLMYYEWPGNVRQLRNMVDAFDVLNSRKIIDKEDIYDILKIPRIESQSPVFNDQRDKLGDYIDYKEKDYIIHALRKTDMNVASAAKILKIARRTLYNKIKKYSIELERKAAK